MRVLALPERPQPDPYRRCRYHCEHDTAAGVTLAELFGGDGPRTLADEMETLSQRMAAAMRRLR